MEKVKIVLIDDHKVVRQGLKLLLGVEESFEVVNEFGSAVKALGYCIENEVDVVVVDLTIPEMSGLEFIAALKEKAKTSVNILVLTMHLDKEYILKACDLGAKGYLVKDTGEDEIITAIKCVSNGEHYFSPQVSVVLSKSLLSRAEEEEIQKSFELTARETDVLRCIVNGLSNKMISPELDISERTVNVHRYNIMKKLEASNTADVVRIALRNNLI